MTALGGNGGGKEPVPDEVTSPVRVMVWSPVLVPVRPRSVFTCAMVRLAHAPTPLQEIVVGGREARYGGGSVARGCFRPDR